MQSRSGTPETEHVVVPSLPRLVGRARRYASGCAERRSTVILGPLLCLPRPYSGLLGRRLTVGQDIETGRPLSHSIGNDLGRFTEVTDQAGGAGSDPWAVTVRLAHRTRSSGGRLATRLRPGPAVRTDLGFARITATEVGGRSIFRLYALDIGDYSISPAKDDVAIAAPTQNSTELALFDTDRDRVHGHLFVSASSVDDPTSLPSLILAALSHISLPARLAGVPDPVTAVLSHSGTIVHAIRRASRHETDYHLRVARLRSGLADGVVVRIELPRADRPLKPRPPDTSLRSSLSAAAPFEEFGRNLKILADDVLAAATALKSSSEWVNLGDSEQARTELLIKSSVTGLILEALHEFTHRYPVPLATRQLRFQQGPAQFVRRVICGEDP